MSDIIYLKQPQKMPEYFTGICECASDIFHAMLGPEDSYQSHQLLALQCVICGEEVRPAIWVRKFGCRYTLAYKLNWPALNVAARQLWRRF